MASPPSRTSARSQTAGNKTVNFHSTVQWYREQVMGSRCRTSCVGTAKVDLEGFEVKNEEEIASEYACEQELACP